MNRVTKTICSPKVFDLVFSVDEDDIDDSPNPSKGFDHSQILNSENINASQKTDVVDGSTSQEKSCETPALRFADQASLSQHMQVQANMKNDTGDDGPNTGSSVNTEVCM